MTFASNIPGFLDPDKVVEELGVKEGMSVADFGSGIGRYSIALLKRVGQKGKVYAIDIQDMLLGRIKKDAEFEGLDTDNLVLIHSDLEQQNGSKLKSGSIDLVIIANLLFLVEDKKIIFQEACRILKENGILVVIDWIDSFAGLGPPQNMVFKKTDAVEMAESTCFVLEKELPSAAHHYILVFKRVHK